MVDSYVALGKSEEEDVNGNHFNIESSVHFQKDAGESVKHLL